MSLRFSTTHLGYKNLRAAPLFTTAAFSATDGSLLSMVGLSGSGKTTLLQLIALPQSSLLSYDRLEIDYTSPSGIHYTGAPVHNNSFLCLSTPTAFQPPWLTVSQSINAISHVHSLVVHEVIVPKLLKDLSLSKNVLDLYPAELSFGMKRRVAILLNLLYCPSLLLFDELTTGLDDATARIVFSAVKQYTVENNAICIVATHRLHLARAFSDQILFIVRRDRTLREIAPSTPYDSLVSMLEADIE